MNLVNIKDVFGIQSRARSKHSLVLGTGGGDVLALDVASGQLKWRISDCHPGGVNAVSSSAKASCIYSGGADGMVCEIDPNSGNLIRKFKASTKAVSFFICFTRLPRPEERFFHRYYSYLGAYSLLQLRSIKLQGMKLKQGFMSKRLIMKVKMRRRKM
ncbi:PREDICTED: uncharacterized protein LOC106326739 [Brassica oleracea var. oleracea]|uniref:uncharacterized protein LOC106326739 n=1 Tax=Brassica oleracea var. oleracea TaxID=109376 RepID=UPI0006A73521|nr:PREDICTED: uncharacterized protein LOC106326739 [Brassica oleracea var. oleracea]